jgi:hypothetical protein
MRRNSPLELKGTLGGTHWYWHTKSNFIVDIHPKDIKSWHQWHLKSIRFFHSPAIWPISERWRGKGPLLGRFVSPVAPKQLGSIWVLHLVDIHHVSRPFQREGKSPFLVEDHIWVSWNGKSSRNWALKYIESPMFKKVGNELDKSIQIWDMILAIKLLPNRRATIGNEDLLLNREPK